MLKPVDFFESSRQVKQSEMMKLAIFACLCAIVLVEGQIQLPDPPPMGISDVEAIYNRVARQAPLQPDEFIQGMPNPMEMAQKVLGMIPDPKAVLSMAQEMAQKILSGRRRREAEREKGERPQGGKRPPGGKRTTEAPAAA